MTKPLPARSFELPSVSLLSPIERSGVPRKSNAPPSLNRKSLSVVKNSLPGLGEKKGMCQITEY
ncbi:MAG: hypothetical protein MSG64_13070 [Pyrinomonadaceae bacterium MAG19_C2-C3]|nr:hypothetical protein [Pyrinomonadaceae bacterium MAG19_C2-C3]